jgi:hypothetical protein
MTDILKINKYNWVNLSRICCIHIKTDVEGNYPPEYPHDIEVEYIDGGEDIFQADDETIENVCRQLELHTVEPTVEWKECEPSPAYLIDKPWKDYE